MIEWSSQYQNLPVFHYRLKTCFKAKVTECSYYVLGGKPLPNMDLIRRHLLAEGTLTKECLVQILHEVTAIFSK